MKPQTPDCLTRRSPLDRIELIAMNMRGRHGPLQAAARLERFAKRTSYPLYGKRMASTLKAPDWGDGVFSIEVPDVTPEERRRALDEERAAGKAGVKIVTWLDDEYPQNLRVALRPPPVLYVRGDLLPQDARAVAVVGSRKATRDYLEFTTDLCYHLAKAGFTIVSGLAKGIDRAAHIGALEAKGRTLAVLGHGLHMTYPPEHHKLSREIASCGGAVLSFFPWGQPPRPFHFPARNWVVAGLSLAVVVVQGSRTSGAMITANAGASMGRDVFAVPGTVGSPLSEGPHALLSDGAYFAQDHHDIISVLDGFHRYDDLFPSLFEGDEHKTSDVRTRYEDVEPGSLEERILRALRRGAATAAALASECGADIGSILATLTLLEMKGYVRPADSGQYVLIPNRQHRP